MNEIESYVAAVVGTLTGMTISEEEWNKLTDPELERTTRIFFKTPSGKRVEYIRADVLDEMKAEIEQLPTNTRTNWNGCCPDIDYPEIEYVDVSKAALLGIIDKYKTESE